MDHQWQERNRPARLERRYQFESYEGLRNFLERVAELSESEDYYPDMGFGRDYVNITIHVEDGAKELGSIHHQFASKIDQLADVKAH